MCDFNPRIKKAIQIGSLFSEVDEGVFPISLS